MGMYVSGSPWSSTVMLFGVTVARDLCCFLCKLGGALKSPQDTKGTGRDGQLGPSRNKVRCTVMSTPADEANLSWASTHERGQLYHRERPLGIDEGHGIRALGLGSGHAICKGHEGPDEDWASDAAPTLCSSRGSSPRASDTGEATCPLRGQGCQVPQLMRSWGSRTHTCQEGAPSPGPGRGTPPPHQPSHSQRNPQISRGAHRKWVSLTFFQGRAKRMRFLKTDSPP